MSLRSLFFPVLFFVLFTIKLTPACAQNSKGEIDKINTTGYFLQREKVRLSNLLEQVDVWQSSQAQTITGLNKKNDSLMKAGAIFDTVSTDVSRQLQLYSSHMDSVHRQVSRLSSQLASAKNLRREYSSVKRNISSLLALTLQEGPVYEGIFKAINLRLDTSDISGEKKMLQAILNAAVGQQQKETAQIDNVNSKKDSLLAAGVVEPTIADKIDARLQMYVRRLDSLGAEIAEAGRQLSTPDVVTREFAYVKAKIFLIDSVVNKNANAREYVVRMIEEGLSRSNQKLFELAAFFGPGGYVIPTDKYNKAHKYFSPIIDSLIKFSDRYELVYRVCGTMVKGYADAASFKKGSPLYQTLATYLKKDEPDNAELNTALSALRASEISKFLSMLIKEKAPQFKSVNKIVFEGLEVGEGEKFPNPAIHNYKSNDPRRRVVIIYWSTLPLE